MITSSVSGEGKAFCSINIFVFFLRLEKDSNYGWFKGNLII
jgi:hypothetical protein